MKILVTGGAGFIGRNLLPLLIGRGDDVTIIDDGRACGLDGLDGATVIERKLYPGRIGVGPGFDAIVHLAAATNTRQSIEAPDQSLRDNVFLTFDLLDWAAQTGVKRFINISASGAIVGSNNIVVDERIVPTPASPYGASKLAAEAYCSAWQQSYGLSTLSLRLSNVYGPHSAHKQSAVAQFVQAALSRGTATVRGGGGQTRDLLYVEDAARAIVRALETDVTGVLQIASGQSISVKGLLNLIARAVGFEPWVRVEEMAAGEVDHVLCDPTRAHSDIGWRSQVSLKDGIDRTVAWFREQAEASDARAISA